MKKLFILLEMLIVFIPAYAVDSVAMKAICTWAKAHDMPATQNVADQCAEEGIVLVAKADVVSVAQQRLEEEAYNLRQIADEKHELYTAAILARKAAYKDLTDFGSANNCYVGNAYASACSSVSGYQELFEVYQSAQRAEEAAMHEFYEADDAAYDAEIAAGLREPNPCTTDPSLPQCNAK